MFGGPNKWGCRAQITSTYLYGYILGPVEVLAMQSDIKKSKYRKQSHLHQVVWLHLDGSRREKVWRKIKETTGVPGEFWNQSVWAVTHREPDSTHLMCVVTANICTVSSRHVYQLFVPQKNKTKQKIMQIPWDENLLYVPSDQTSTWVLSLSMGYGYDEVIAEIKVRLTWELACFSHPLCTVGRFSMQNTTVPGLLCGNLIKYFNM